MKFEKDTPYRGKEFDPCDQAVGPVSDQDSESSSADANLDQEDGQIEGLLSSSLGYESGALTSDEAAAEYVARDAEIARQEILAEEAQEKH
ncbi:MAG: hypothetical protein HFJ63_01900 [Atopobiaceae bacterium]|jgi:hypothetical protein|uniref:Uncharacterized protein n=1 Tax=Muricaecibacterium torontonense TaxID=3032871 RepID=A0A4S2F1F6_9ACTN|nr:hypothetical protein [Muricaecibacterium torontonense]MCI8675462.1 hypothetical protein [Atopobiaceae bacterium]TGY62729.1 hypothetical protein E5334_04830 [Muricaecibacterium torontonense]